MKNVSEVVAGLQELFNQIKYFHWQTKSLAQHEALGDAFDDLEELIDNFVEVAMGKYGRPSTKNQKLEMFDLEDVDIVDWASGVVDYLISFDDVLDETQDTDLLNIRDEMMAVFNKVKYLLTLKENKMKKKKVIKLTENDLHRIVERVIKEQSNKNNQHPSPDEIKKGKETGCYTVNSGDQLLKIAKAFNVTVDDLVKLNGLLNSAEEIYPKQKLRVQNTTKFKGC
jgi:LysM repeat protein/DNA-binding ferritin-like protein